MYTKVDICMYLSYNKVHEYSSFGGNKMKERRQHKLFLTKNREYHFRDKECVGVRDRKTNHWIRRHLALRAHLTGYVDTAQKFWKSPIKGGRLHLISEKGSVLTSPLITILRPCKETVWSYTSFAKAGEIALAASLA